MYKIKFVLGDWSCDGHSISETFIVESSIPVEKLREVHFKSTHVLGFDIGSICQEYGKNWIEKEFYYKLKSILLWGDDDIDDTYWEEENDRYIIQDSIELLGIWLDCLQAIEPNLVLNIIDDDIPKMHFSGYDNHNRHLNVPGYGLYE